MSETDDTVGFAMKQKCFEIGPWMLELWQDYSEWFKGSWNWRNFHFLVLTVEDEAYLDAIEFHVCVLGLCLRATYYRNRKSCKEDAP